MAGFSHEYQQDVCRKGGGVDGGNAETEMRDCVLVGRLSGASAGTWRKRAKSYGASKCKGFINN